MLLAESSIFTTCDEMIKILSVCCQQIEQKHYNSSVNEKFSEINLKWNRSLAKMGYICMIKL